ncbi:BCCT family transporter [Alloyangia pacifica]|uniref:Choline-glycine betaine transporter n=1 Tax=Alloyangia pacifica TaxID=311180 RepID=A0A1I6QT05_9RHOB|nr:BCCT family transporter [Alloyangia pacifica]SDF97893.1 Choline-glycine betaine transporter [Alloyangia pacifica]SFS55534.1 Choline-glycine betaine transporter [Alloyangia pacifica]
MPTDTQTAQLQLRTVPAGFYRGFNPAVSITAKALIVALMLLILLAPAMATRELQMLKDLVLTRFAGWYVYLLAAFVVFNLGVICLPVSGRLRLGPPGARPEIGTFSWLAMMFCAGIGIGILVFSVSEPVSDFLNNPDIMAGGTPSAQAETLPSAMRFVFFHWGLSAWSSYVIVGLALGLACHRNGHPLTMRSGLEPLVGKRLEGRLGDVIDVLAILATVSGIATTIVLGLEHICSGLSELTGSPFFADQAGNPPLVALLTALVLAIAATIASIVSGMERGVKWTSHCGIALAFVVLAVFVIFGGKAEVLSVFAESVQRYVETLPSQIVMLYDPVQDSARHVWQGDWTIFYWAWWIAFAPFVGLFLVRISKGRTVRQFVLGAMLGPSLMCFVWFSGTGGSALLMEIDGRAGGAILQAEHAYRIVAAVNVMLGPTGAALMTGALTLLFVVLIMASSTAAIIAIKAIGAGGSPLGETPLHSMLWAVAIAALTGAIIAAGGIGAIRDAMLVMTLPFSVVLAGMFLSVMRHLVRGA